tara:strand:- start:1319 stop:1993 length:675 start_codon:yes stop_codon:yes gene_type:complete
MALNFKKDKYCIIRNSISKELADLCYNYLILKRKVSKTLMDVKYFTPFEKIYGVLNDDQVPNTWSIYGDVLMEVLLNRLLTATEKATKLKLIPNYSYSRLYKKGDILHRHKDRFSCEISTTLFIGGDEWPIFINPDPKEGVVKKQKNILMYQASKKRGNKVILKPGDMLVYRGIDLEHYRDEFEGENCAQVFFHYNNIETKGSQLNIYDGRPHLGLPAEVKVRR